MGYSEESLNLQKYEDGNIFMTKKIYNKLKFKLCLIKDISNNDRKLLIIRLEKIWSNSYKGIIGKKIHLLDYNGSDVEYIYKEQWLGGCSGCVGLCEDCECLLINYPYESPINENY